MRGTLCSLSARYNIDIQYVPIILALLYECYPSQLCRTFRPPRSAGTQRWGSSSSVGWQRRRRVRLSQRGLGHCCGLRRQRSERRGKRREAFERHDSNEEFCWAGTPRRCRLHMLQQARGGEMTAAPHVALASSASWAYIHVWPPILLCWALSTEKLGENEGKTRDTVDRDERV